MNERTERGVVVLLASRRAPPQPESAAVDRQHAEDRVAWVDLGARMTPEELHQALRWARAYTAAM